MNSPDSNPAKPAWINVAAVGGLVVFLAVGYLTLRHLTTQDPAARSVELPGSNEPETPQVFRLEQQPGRFVFSDADIADADEFRLLAERDPKTAAAVIERLEDTPMRDENLFDLMQIWVEKDAQQAADWVVALPVGQLKNDATAELGLAWGQDDPVAASRWVDINIFTENAPAGAASLTSAWVRNDIDAASEWVSTLDVDAPARREAIKTLAFHLGELDPQRGLAWIARLKPDDRNLILVNFTASWAGRDPEAAGRWLRFQANGIDPITLDQATLAVIHSWTTADAPTARDWIADIADGDLKEKAKATFAETLASTSPAEALPWAQDIDDPERRLEVTMVVYEEWILQDKDAFKSGIRSQWDSLDQDVRHEIYDLLLDHDREFKDELFRRLDEDGDEP